MTDQSDTEFVELKEPNRLASRALTAMGRLSNLLRAIQSDDKAWSWERGADITPDTRKTIVAEAERLLETVTGEKPKVVVEFYRGTPYVIEKPSFVDLQFPGFDEVIENEPLMKNKKERYL